MAKWEHWFWVTVVFLLAFQAQVGKSARLEVAKLDTLTAPTLEPEPSEPEDEPKLTIITPSSVVVMSTPASRPTTNTPSTQLPVQKESVSHSFSVVSVKYSSSKAAAEAAAASTSSEEVTWSAHTSLNTTTPVEEEQVDTNLNQGAGLKQTLPRVDSSTVVTTREEFTQQDDSSHHSSSEAEAIEAVFAATTADKRAPKAIVSNEHQSNDRQKFLNSFPHLSVTETESPSPTAAASITTSTSKPVITTKEATEAEALFTTPAEVVEDTEAPATSAPSHRLRSETAEALNELGFEYNEYIDDSDLMGDESNDEVIPPFHESDFEDELDHDEVVNESDYVGSARAIPSKSGILYKDERLLTEAEVATSRRQSKKAPLPHHYEPSTIVGITIGAFLLIFIGTVGLGAFIYQERYANKPHTLDDRFSDSGGCSTSVDDSIGRVSHIDCSGFDVPTSDTYCEEMYNLDNDSFLNSLETVAMPTMLWTVAPNSDSDV